MPLPRVPAFAPRHTGCRHGWPNGHDYSHEPQPRGGRRTWEVRLLLRARRGLKQESRRHGRVGNQSSRRAGMASGVAGPRASTSLRDRVCVRGGVRRSGHRRCASASWERLAPTARAIAFVFPPAQNRRPRRRRRGHRIPLRCASRRAAAGSAHGAVGCDATREQAVVDGKLARGVTGEHWRARPDHPHRVAAGASTGPPVLAPAVNRFRVRAVPT